MLCSKLATRKDGFQFPCGQCLNCRVNFRRDWQSRLLLEAASHDYSAFVTFTLRDVGTPHVLSKGVVRGLVSKLSETHEFRYFIRAEYGTKYGRAHYHAHLFSDRLFTRAQLESAWPFGSIDIGNTEPASLDYVLGYLLKPKKLVSWPIEHRYPEFRSFSKGLGKLALPHLLIDGTELPREFKAFGRTWPIGRYLRERAKKMGLTISERKVVTLERLEAQALRAMLPVGKFTTEEYEAAKTKMNVDRKDRLIKLQQRAIRAAYLEKHGHVPKGNKNETF